MENLEDTSTKDLKSAHYGNKSFSQLRDQWEIAKPLLGINVSGTPGRRDSIVSTESMSSNSTNGSDRILVGVDQLWEHIFENTKAMDPEDAKKLVSQFSQKDAKRYIVGFFYEILLMKKIAASKSDEGTSRSVEENEKKDVDSSFSSQSQEVARRIPEYMKQIASFSLSSEVGELFKKVRDTLSSLGVLPPSPEMIAERQRQIQAHYQQQFKELNQELQPLCKDIEKLLEERKLYVTGGKYEIISEKIAKVTENSDKVARQIGNMAEFFLILKEERVKEPIDVMMATLWGSLKKLKEQKQELQDTTQPDINQQSQQLIQRRRSSFF